MRVRVALGVAIFVLTASACGSGTSQPSATGNAAPTAKGSGRLVTPRGTASGRTTPRPGKTLRPTSKPSYNGLVVVGKADSGSTVLLRVGEYLRVELDSAYRQPASSRRRVVKRTSATGGYPSGRRMVAVFRAVAPGRADVTSSTDYACLHSTPSCALPQQLWIVHVVVKR